MRVMVPKKLWADLSQNGPFLGVFSIFQGEPEELGRGRKPIFCSVFDALQPGSDNSKKLGKAWTS